MKIAISGATGLIGSRFALRLLEEGHSLIVISRDPARAKQKLGLPAEYRAAIDAAGLAGADAVVNLSGEPVADGRWTEARKRRIRDSRIETTRATAQAIRDVQGAKPRVWLNASAIGIYGDRGDEMLTESSSPGTDFLAEVCQAWEAEALGGEPPAPGLRRIVLRTGVVLSEAGGALGKLLPIFQAGLGGPIGRGARYMSWIHIDDQISAMVHALQSETLTGAVNAVAPQPATNAEFTEALGKACHRPTLLPVPPPALKMALGEMSEAILSSARVLPEQLIRDGFTFAHPQIEEALQQIVGQTAPGDQVLIAHQWVPKTPAEVFPFFSDEKNLETLTPPWLSFKVKGKNTPEIGEGTLINYQLGLHGLPLRWQSKITDWRPNERFRDFQVHGPYAKWDHTHTFRAVGGGTLLSDRVVYRVPMGGLGRLAAGWKVDGDVRKIFAYRRQRIEEIFGA